MIVPRRNLGVPSVGRTLDRLRMGGRKTAMACGLLAIMSFMWIRVLIGHRPASAAAAPPSAPKQAVLHKGPVKVKLVELPKRPGRHDEIATDFFAAKDRTFSRRNSAGRDADTNKEVPVASTGVQEVIRRVTQTAKLEAVLWSESPRAFINDRLLSVGGKLTVKDGAGVFELEVLQIYVDSVLVKCDGVQLTLELAQELVVIN